MFPKFILKTSDKKFFFAVFWRGETEHRTVEEVSYMSKPAEVNGKKENAACKKNSEKQKRAEQGIALPGSDSRGRYKV